MQTLNTVPVCPAPGASCGQMLSSQDLSTFSSSSAPVVTLMISLFRELCLLFEASFRGFSMFWLLQIPGFSLYISLHFHSFTHDNLRDKLLGLLGLFLKCGWTPSWLLNSYILCTINMYYVDYTTICYSLSSCQIPLDHGYRDL